MRLLLGLLCFWGIHVAAQTGTAQKHYNHRIWIDPTQIITGQYSLTYSWKAHHGINWYEITPGYRYLLYRPSGHYYAPGGILATPDFGARFYGPSISFSFDKYYLKLNSRIRQAATRDSMIRKFVANATPSNSVRWEFEYQFLQHKPACYYGGEQDYSYTYSSVKSAITGKILWSKIFLSRNEHTALETYYGLGLQWGFGKTTRYNDTLFEAHAGPRYFDFCVRDLNSPDVIKTSEHLWYGIPLIYLGIRLGIQK